MKLTGKCKEDFNKWLRENYYDFDVVKYQTPYGWSAFDLFYKLPESMQQGVLIDFFDSNQYQGIYFFSNVFNFYYSKKIPSQTHNDIVVRSLEQCNNIYNESKQDIIREKKV